MLRADHSYAHFCVQKCTKMRCVCIIASNSLGAISMCCGKIWKLVVHRRSGKSFARKKQEHRKNRMVFSCAAAGSHKTQQ